MVTTNNIITIAIEVREQLDDLIYVYKSFDDVATNIVIKHPPQLKLAELLARNVICVN